MRSLMITLFILGSVAAGLASPKSGVKGLLVMKGKCSHLVVSGKDFTADCGSRFDEYRIHERPYRILLFCRKGTECYFFGSGLRAVKTTGR